jgi:ABC-type phosphate transport system substrate-binding protein
MRRVIVRLGCRVGVLLALVLAAFLPLPAPPLSDDVVVVANPTVPVSDLTFTELRRIFLGERQFWSSNLRISLLLSPPAARDREVLLKTVYDMSEAQLRQHWIGKVFRAEVASAPQMYYSDEEILQAVAAIPGSIAAVNATRIPRGLKVLRIDGRLPGESGYRLH